MKKIEKTTYHHNAKERENHIRDLFVHFDRGHITRKKLEDRLIYYAINLFGENIE